MNSIDGATALKLDETYEIKNNEEQNALIDSFESEEENKIAEQTSAVSASPDEIPAGVSIESASYMEHNDNTNYEDPLHQNNSSNEKNFIDSVIITKNDSILIFDGGHGIQVQEQSKFIEFKQGPYIQDLDKKHF